MQIVAKEFKPYNYQVFATKHVILNGECGPWLDMGLGKTVVTLTATQYTIQKGLSRKVLIVAPKKVAETVWTDEVATWQHLANDANMNIVQILGNEKQRRAALRVESKIYIIGVDNLVWLVAQQGNAWQFDTLIVDELSCFKNPTSKRFQALRLIRPYVNRCVGLTGTPSPNGLLDLWGQMFVIDKGVRLGHTFTSYRDKYFKEGRRDGNTGRVFNYDLQKGDGVLGQNFNAALIMDKISDICFSMKTEDFLELPERIEINRRVKLSATHYEQYKAFERDAVLQLEGQELTAVNAAALTTKLMQYANGCMYDEARNVIHLHDDKMEALDEIVEGLNGKPLLVFYAFIHDKDRILARYKYAKALTDAKQVAEWNAGKIRLLVAHPASAGHGLNLQHGGENMLFFSSGFSLERDTQAIKRVHRNGVKGAVTVTRLVAAGTIDEDVLDALNGKKNLQDAVLDAVKARVSEYNVKLLTN